MKTVLTLTQERLAQLNATFGVLRNRVREAVASEMAKAVGDAVRDWLTTLLRKQEPARAYHRPRAEVDFDEWADDPGWDDPPSPQTFDDIDGNEPEIGPPMNPSRTWAMAITWTAAVVRWCLNHRLPTWVMIGLGLTAGIVTMAGGPLARTALATIAAAVELATMAPPAVRPFD